MRPVTTTRLAGSPAFVHIGTTRIPPSLPYSSDRISGSLSARLIIAKRPRAAT